MGSLAISEKYTVVQLKHCLFEKWAELSVAVAPSLLQDDEENILPIVTPQSANHIRLRDFKGGKQSGPLRDDRYKLIFYPRICCKYFVLSILGRCLLGLADGRKLIVQVLQKEEQIAADDILISLRLATYFGDDKVRNLIPILF